MCRVHGDLDPGPQRKLDEVLIQGAEQNLRELLGTQRERMMSTLLFYLVHLVHLLRKVVADIIKPQSHLSLVLTCHLLNLFWHFRANLFVVLINLCKHPSDLLMSVWQITDSKYHLPLKAPLKVLWCKCLTSQFVNDCRGTEGGQNLLWLSFVSRHHNDQNACEPLWYIIRFSGTLNTEQAENTSPLQELLLETWNLLRNLVPLPLL